MAKRKSNRRSSQASRKLPEEDRPASSVSPGSPVLKRPFNFSRQGNAILICILLFALVSAVFLPSLRNDFVNYDDPDFVTENVHVQRGLTWEGLKAAFRSDPQTTYWAPLMTLSHMLDCQLYGLRPWGHHLTNVLLHAVNVLLAFLVLRRMTGATWRSLFVAALFGLHPLRVESVTWITERKDVLSTFFWMLTLWAYARFAEESRARSDRTKIFYGLALGFFALGLMSKPMLVTVPCVLLLLDYWPLERLEQKSASALLAEKAPFFLLAAFAGAITFMVQNSGGALATTSGLSLTARLGNALVSYYRYLGKLFCPVNLAVFYPHPRDWPVETMLLAGLLLLGISVFVVALRRQHRYLPVGWLWFVGTLVPVIGLVQSGDQSIADRFTYVPSLGFFILLAWGAHDLTGRWPYRRIALSAAAVAALGCCVVLTLRQIGFWQNGETLFRHALEVTDNNYVAHYSLGVALEKQGQLDEAISQYQEALKLKPDYAKARSNLGAAFSKKGQFDDAIAQLQQALKLNADPAKVHYNLGLTLARKGRLPDAILEFQEAVRLQPDFSEAHNNLGVALDREGRLDEAIAELQDAVRLQPESADFCANLGNALARKGRLDEAATQFQQAVKLQPESARLRFNLGKALAGTGRLDESITQLNEAIRLQPDLAEAHNTLGVVLIKKGRLDEAINQLQEAVRLKPDYAEARKNLAAALNIKGTLEKQPSSLKQP